MGVSNNGILFLGLKEEDVDLSKVEGFDPEYAKENGLADALWGLDCGLDARWDNGMYPTFALVGFELANSGSYGCKKIDIMKLLGRISHGTDKFVKIFGVEPKIWIMNYQS